MKEQNEAGTGSPSTLDRSHRARLEALTGAVREALRDELRGGGRYALLDFPNHSNVGDSAIWLGELAALRSLGLPGPSYVCDADTFSAAQLRRRVGDGPVLLHGGGNLGDLYGRHQRFREHVLRSLPGSHVIQLPQTIRFLSRSNLHQAREVFGTHADLTVLVRDSTSLSIAREELGVRARLCPDSAFCLGALPRPNGPVRPFAWLLRSDREAVEGHRRQLSDDSVPEDWLAEAPRGPVSLSRRITRLALNHPSLAHRFQSLLRISWTAAARQRMGRGVRLLTSARVVITDRLHGHILCLLLGIPHVVLPDRHGKLRGFIEAWTSGSDLFVWVPEPRAAPEAAEALLLRPSK